MHWTRLLLVVVGTAGCGGMDSRFEGTWRGALVVTITTPTGPVVQSGQSRIVVLDNDGSAAMDLCPGQRLAFVGQGQHGTWSGVASCAAPTASCPTASLVARSASLTLKAGPTLQHRLEGTAAGCQEAQPVVVEFEGTK